MMMEEERRTENEKKIILFNYAINILGFLIYGVRHVIKRS